jgi:ankyrin repeat protein
MRMAVRSNQDHQVAEVLDSVQLPAQKLQLAQAGFHPLMEHATPSVNILNLLLEQGIDVNALNEVGDTALHTLALKDQPNLDIWRRLIQAKIDINQRDADGHTAWRFANQQQNPNAELLYMLLKAGARIENNAQRQNAFSSAMAQRHPALMARVLLNGHPIQPLDNTNDLLAERLLNNPDNYRRFLQDLGRDQTTKFIKSILEAEVKEDLQPMDLARWPKSSLGTPEQVAQRYFRETYPEANVDVQTLNLAEFEEPLQQFTEKLEQDAKATIARRVINNIMRPFKPILRQARQDYYTN